MYKDLIQTFNLPDVVIAKSYENWKFFLNDKGELFWNRHNETRKYNIIEKVLCFDLIFNKQIISHKNMKFWCLCIFLENYI